MAAASGCQGGKPSTHASCGTPLVLTRLDDAPGTSVVVGVVGPRQCPPVPGLFAAQDPVSAGGRRHSTFRTWQDFASETQLTGTVCTASEYHKMTFA